MTYTGSQKESKIVPSCAPESAKRAHACLFVSYIENAMQATREDGGQPGVATCRETRIRLTGATLTVGLFESA